MKRKFDLLCLAIAITFVFLSSAETFGQVDLLGKVEIDGSSTVAPISSEAADLFSEISPKVAVSVGVSGTGGGFKRFTKGDTDISDASRPIKQKEFARCKENNVSFIELPVAYDGLTVIVNKQNEFIDQLTVDQLKKIFRDDMKAAKWSDVKEGWPETEIEIFAPGTDSGTFDYFKEVMVGKEDAAIRSDMSVSEDDHIIVQGVSNTANAIGFLGAAYYFENVDVLKAVPIVNPESEEAVVVSAETIESGAYAPFSRPLFIYVNAKSARRPEVRKFVTFYLENATELAEAVGYVGLPEEIQARVMEHFTGKLTGTHFIDENGEKREGPVSELYNAENLVK